MTAAPPLHGETGPDSATPEGIARWLGTGIDGYGERGRWAFDPLQDEIGRGYHVVDDLRSIYGGLDESTRRRWREALRALLETRCCDATKRESTKWLLTLACLCRAFEVRSAIPALADGQRGMFGAAVTAAVSLMEPNCGDTRECLERLRESKHFDSNYAGIMLVALCHAAPDRLARPCGQFRRSYAGTGR